MEEKPELEEVRRGLSVDSSLMKEARYLGISLRNMHWPTIFKTFLQIKNLPKVGTSERKLVMNALLDTYLYNLKQNFEIYDKQENSMKEEDFSEESSVILSPESKKGYQ